MAGSSELTQATPRRFALWLMGPTSSGKTTLAELLLSRLRSAGVAAMHYDGDEVRDFFGDSLGFAPADRLRVVSTLTHLANKSLDAGLNVIVSALTANEDARAHIAAAIDNLVIIYVKCPISICAERDPKGLYLMADNGEIDTLIGRNSEYKPPAAADLVVDTDALSPDKGVEAVIGYLIESGSISAAE